MAASLTRATVVGPIAVAFFGALAVFVFASQQRDFDWQLDPLAVPAVVGIGGASVQVARGRLARALALVPLTWVLVWAAALAWWTVAGAPWIFSDRWFLGAAYIATVITVAGFAVGTVPLLLAWLMGVRERATDRSGTSSSSSGPPPRR